MTAPHANPLLFGHAFAEQVMLRAWVKGSLPHAWLLRGPRGIGKATLAYRFARRLLAGPNHERAATDPDEPVFRMVANKAHPDLRVLERVVNPKTGKLAREILIDQVRQVEEALHGTAARAGHKVLVIDAADELNLPGANALLKLLEEPPSGTVLLLICQRPSNLPRTILSRCMQLPLTPLSGPELLRGLAVMAPELREERRVLLAGLAGGSVGQALEMEAAGWLDRYAELVKGLAEAQGSIAARVTLAGNLVRGNDGGGFRSTAELVGFALRRLAVLQAGRPPARELFAGELALLHGLAAGRGLDRWVALWDKLTALAGRVDQLNLDPVQATLQVVQAICGAAPETELSIA